MKSNTPVSVRLYRQGRFVIVLVCRTISTSPLFMSQIGPRYTSGGIWLAYLLHAYSAMNDSNLTVSEIAKAFAHAHLMLIAVA